MRRIGGYAAIHSAAAPLGGCGAAAGQPSAGGSGGSSSRSCSGSLMGCSSA